ncbi:MULTISPECIES: heavy-metal-associated domain-containing protein [Bosea]|uniref:HMA domain-containing protein n=1 Tax=Bosea vaviloviae TaxID=1526658 RepID=A0A0N1N2S6_9HYPH|nr:MULTISPECIES: heavy-metal-associated domain-containing protein [Bosea]KPH78368.1 hypothetical protein AE618_21530 [Bosea vaviloviae]
MCSCQQHSNSTSETVATPSASGLNFRVDDMTCGHCAGTIKKAIETTLPGTTVDADPASKLVNVTGFGDYAAIKAIVTDAGYTPSAAPVAA